MGILERTFHLKEAGTNVYTEVMAGITTFMTMAYILAVNPNILSASGMDRGAVFTATCIASCVATLVMALLSNYPFVLSAGMGLNAYFAFTVVLGMGYTWQVALTAVFVEGIIFLILSLTNVREAIFNSIPLPLKHAVSAGIGLFIAFIGLQNAKIVVDSVTLVSLFSWNAETFNAIGITVILAFAGILITGLLMAWKVPGNILIGIFITWGLGIACEKFGLYIPNPEAGAFSVIPSFESTAIPSLTPTFCQLDFSFLQGGSNAIINFFIVMFAFLFVDMFDTLGTIIGVASKTDMLRPDGTLPRIRGALLADSIGTIVGALLGTSTITTYVESSAGVSAGGRTGLTAIVSGLLFAVALFLSPIFLAIPSFATAPALIIVGFLMITPILKVDFSNLYEAIPAYITLIAMPFTYSISDGIVMGTISYVVLNLLGGSDRRKTISITMYLLAIVFLAKYIYL